MMNVVALGLVLSSLVTAGFWSPTQVNHHKKGHYVIVKERHRVVVVEYDPESYGNTKILISPHVSHQAKEKLSSVADEAKGKAKEGVKDAKGKMEDKIKYIKVKAKEDVGGTHEIICNAVDKCKQNIASTIGITKHKGTDAAHDTTEKADKVGDQVKDKVAETIGKTKDTLFDKSDKVSSRAHDVKDPMHDKVQQVGGGVKGGVKEVVDTSKTIGKDVLKNVTSKLDEVRDKADRVKEEGERELGDIYGRGRELVKDMWSYIASLRLVGSAMGIAHLLGFATAYGMCVWVTFVSSYVLAGALPIQQFGMVQSKVYPVYFRILAYTVMVTLIGHLYGQRNMLFLNTVVMAQAYGLLGSFVMVLFNLLYLEPRATKVMFQRRKMEKEYGRGLSTFGRDSFVTEEDHHQSSTKTPPTSAAWMRQLLPQRQEKSNSTDDAMSQINKLSMRLRKLNSYSSILNIITFVALTLHLAYLGQWLHVTC